MAQTSKKATRRQLRRQRLQRTQLRNRIIWGVIGLAVLGLIGFLVWNQVRPPLGVAVPPDSNAGDHLPDLSPLPQYNSNPPTSGPHYAVALPEGFYDEDSPEVRSLPNPVGHIIHSMEHGYVVFWYNCAILSEAECTQMKDDIRAVMREVNDFKVIAFPYTNMNFPVVATSWGRILEMDSFDPVLAAQMIQRNRNRSPEPQAR